MRLGQIGDQTFASAVTDLIQGVMSMSAPLGHGRLYTGVHTPSEYSALSTLPGNYCPLATVQYQEERVSTEMSQLSQNLEKCPIAASSRSPQQPEGREASCSDIPAKTPEPTIKKRKRIDAHQLEALNRMYARTAFPSRGERQQLAKQLDMSAESVRMWLVHIFVYMYNS